MLILMRRASIRFSLLLYDEFIEETGKRIFTARRMIPSTGFRLYPEFMMWIGKIKFCSWRRRRRGEVRTVQVGQIDERKWHPDWCMFWTPGDFPFPITNKPLHYVPPNFRLLKITKCFSFCCCHFRSVCLREMFKVESFCKMTFKCSASIRSAW